jgi:hypothetical protein
MWAVVHQCMQMNQVRLKSAQPAVKFLNVILEFALYVWTLASFETQMNIHVRLGIGSSSHQEKVRRPSFTANCTPALETPARLRMLYVKKFALGAKNTCIDVGFMSRTITLHDQTTIPLVKGRGNQPSGINLRESIFRNQSSRINQGG